ncbi:hypothetical protein HanRHA438_Chr04g0162241 [Helianthus annuus]|nr:hypothetical protein HanRHA438_Chr04g0162241 [Helianthus annuus]
MLGAGIELESLGTQGLSLTTPPLAYWLRRHLLFMQNHCMYFNRDDGCIWIGLHVEAREAMSGYPYSLPVKCNM